MKDSKNNKLVENFKIDDVIAIKVQQGKGKIIGKTGDGIVCFFNKTNTSNLKLNSIIDCKISQIKDSVLIISVIKKALTTIYKVGQTMDLAIDVSEKKSAIAKTEDGTICFFDKSDTIKPRIGTISACEITQIKENVLVLRVTKVIKTASKRQDDGLAALLNKYKKQ